MINLSLIVDKFQSQTELLYTDKVRTSKLFKLPNFGVFFQEESVKKKLIVNELIGLLFTVPSLH